MLPLLILLFLTSLLGPVIPLPQGAPESACESLLPLHPGAQPQTSPSPFRVTPYSSTVGQGQTLRVDIESNPPNLIVKGFMLQARSTSPPYQVVGQFAPTNEDIVKLINCNGAGNTVTHTNTSPKSELGFEWQAPTDYVGEVIFNSTVAPEYSDFWVGIESIPVQVLQGINVQPGISTTRRPISPTIPPFPSTTPKAQLSVSDPIYNGCNSIKTCFGFPDGCVATKDCRALSVVNVQGERYIFELKAYPDSQIPAYVALGLSTDVKMGDDSVMECVPTNGKINAYTSLTTAPAYGSGRTGIPQNIIKLIESSFIDGKIYCKLERDSVSNVKGMNFDLVNNQYHLLLATGESLKENSVGYHTIGKLASGQKFYLAEVQQISGGSTLLLRLHAAFMLIAWIGTASLGIIFARYFKQTWVGSQLFGKDYWFVWHRGFMVLTWLFTMAGFILIFVHLGSWSAEDNPHAILGLITTIICFLQPIGALFRPAPDSKNRPIFNWVHWLGGNVAAILGIATIFFAVKLAKAELPSWMDYILVAFVAFHVFMHIIFSIAGCVSDKRNGKRVTAFPMADMSPTRGSMVADRKQDSPFSRTRKALLSLYIIVIILFVIALVVIAVLAPIEKTVESIKSKIMP